MIRPIKIITIVFLLCLAVSGKCLADDGPGQKLSRGIVNIATAPLEIPKQTVIYYKEGVAVTKHFIVWIGCGVVKGMANMVGRAGSGVWDIVSFPFGVPENYEPLFEPAYVVLLQHFGNKLAINFNLSKGVSCSMPPCRL